MKAAITAWLDAAARGASHEHACTAAAVAALDASGGDPWAVVEQAGALARARPAEAARDLGLTARLQVREPGARGVVVAVPAGAPYPQTHMTGRRARGAFDTPRELARRVVAHARSATSRTPSVGLDPACGPGAFLVALHESGVDAHGLDLDPAAVAVARVAAPSARVEVFDSLLDPLPSADLVVGNPPFVPPERQDKALRARLRDRLPWLSNRFDLAVPFAAVAVAAARPGGGIGLVLPAPLLVEPYGAPLRRQWLSTHQITELDGPFAFRGAAVRVVVVALAPGRGPARLPGGIDASELLTLPNATLDARLRPGDALLLTRIRAASIPLGELCEVDTGVVSHGPNGGKARLLSDTPVRGHLPYVDARDLIEGRVRWLRYAPEEMHRAKRLALFESPKLLVQRLRGAGPVRAWLDTDGTVAGHTLTVVRPLTDRVDLSRLQDLLTSPLIDGLLRIERGERLDLYPRDVRELPVPRSWLEDPWRPLAEAWGLDESQAARLESWARG